MNPIWEASGIFKSYPLTRGKGKAKTEVLSGVSLSVGKGEIVALVGESGSGKSTLARLALALERPDSGVFSFQGKTYEQYGAPRNLYRHIQMVFQSTCEAADPAWKALEVIAEPLVHLTALSSTQREARAKSAGALAHFPIDCLEKPISALSGGQRQRACIARALSVEPNFLVLDEATSGLDASLQEEILFVLQDLARNLSVSMLLITHDLRLAAGCAQRIAFLSEGVIVEIALPSDLGQLQHPYARMLFAASL